MPLSFFKCCAFHQSCYECFIEVQVQFIKQDLVNATTLGTASWRPVDRSVGDNATAVAAAARHFFTPAPTSTVIASYDDDKRSQTAAEAMDMALGQGQDQGQAAQVEAKAMDTGDWTGRQGLDR